MWAVKIQRSDRQLPWDSLASKPCSLHTYHHYNMHHPDHCRVPALTFPKAPPPSSPRNVPGFLLLVFYLHCSLLPPSSSNSFGFMGVVCFFCSSSLSFLTSAKSFFHQKAFVFREGCKCSECFMCGQEIIIQNLIQSTMSSALPCVYGITCEIHARKYLWKWGYVFDELCCL